ncbi:MAG: C40 family peptidase [Flavobacteriaceae bacterium]|nr:C40 family peptidase [Flavobacteriaceae bacterium]
MKKLIILFISAFIVASCGSSRKKYDRNIILDPSTRNIPKTPEKPLPKTNDKEVVVYNETEATSTKPIELKVKNIIEVARSFHGTPYRFGGTTSKGMDCSGLIYTAFKEEDILLPRISRDMAKKGKKINLNDVTIGDLVFFKTDSRRNDINHVGLVVDVFPGKILFIHSSTSQGVIVSAMDESYWNKAFVEARRVI